MNCPTCQAVTSNGARFCPQCGTTLPVSPDAVARYTQTMREYLADGVLEPWEVSELAILRRELNIPEAQHALILGGFDYVDHNTIVLETDISDVSDFRAGQQCQFRILIRNVEPYAIRRCSIRYQIVQGGEQLEVLASSIPARAYVDYTLPFIPQRAGLYEFSGTIDVDDDKGRSYRYQFRGINFTVASPYSGVNEVNIGENFTGVLNVGNKQGDELESGLNLDSHWSPVNLKPIPMRRDGVFVPAPFSSQYTPTTSCRLVVQRSTGETQLDVCAQDTVTFGRSVQKSTVPLAIEPYLPAQLYHQNLARTKMISGCHFSISRVNQMVHLSDVGSKKGTMRNGQVCYRLTQYPLQTGDRISVANVLDLQVQVLYDVGTHEPNAVILRRQNNLVTKQHCIVFDNMGLWLDRESVVGAVSIGTVEAPLQVRRSNQGMLLCNVSCGPISIQGKPLHNGESVPLSIGQHIALKDGTISIVSI